MTSCNDDPKITTDTVPVEDLSMISTMKDMAISAQEVDQGPPSMIMPSADYRVVPCADDVGQEIEDLECALLTMPQNSVRETKLALDLFIVRPQIHPQANVLPEWH